jgi:hypothetical protein
MLSARPALPALLGSALLAAALACDPSPAAAQGPAPHPVWVDEDLHPGAVRWQAIDRATVGCRTLSGFDAWNWSVTAPGAGYGTQMLRDGGECVVSINPTSWREGPPTGDRRLVRLCREGSERPTGCYLFWSDTVGRVRRS